MVIAADNAQRVDRPNRYSDRDRMRTGKDSEDKLEQALKTGETKDFYRRELEKMGLKITSVNYDKTDYCCSLKSQSKHCETPIVRFSQLDRCPILNSHIFQHFCNYLLRVEVLLGNLTRSVGVNVIVHPDRFYCFSSLLYRLDSE